MLWPPHQLQSTITPSAFAQTTSLVTSLASVASQRPHYLKRQISHVQRLLSQSSADVMTMREAFSLATAPPREDPALPSRSPSLLAKTLPKAPMRPLLARPMALANARPEAMTGRSLALAASLIASSPSKAPPKAPLSHARQPVTLPSAPAPQQMAHSPASV